MKIALISDIHANLHALQAVWQDLELQRPDVVYCLGDLVGYGAYPNEVVDFMRARQIPTVLGNYDDGVGFDQDDCGCAYTDPAESMLGKRSLHWTRRQTTTENKRFLQELPIQIRLEAGRPHLLLVHGSPRKINEYLYADRPPATFERIARLAGTDVLFFGHTHLPYQKSTAGTLFVNAGSVGKPKDGDPRAGYVLFSSGLRHRVEFRRLAYDVAAAARAVRQAGLPESFALALETGGKTVLPDVAEIAQSQEASV
jgi:putative phosphoesterase